MRDLLVTLFLFTKSDIKTTVLPVTMIAIVSGPLHSSSHLFHTIFWIWLHLLQFDVSNQTVGAEEDRKNKPDRPLPSGRISMRNALILRWLLVPLCFIYSVNFSLSTLFASVGLVVMTIIYDELGAHKQHWTIRNLVNALGFGCFELGASLVAGYNRDYLDHTGILAVTISVGIFATTIHTQDFKDVIGDALNGRRTLPIVSPRVARLSVVIGMTLWSVGLSIIWELDARASTVIYGLGVLVSCRFMLYNDTYSDQVSFYWYNVWLVVAHALPGLWRVKSV